MATPKPIKSPKPAAIIAAVTTEAPRDPRWDNVKKTADQLHAVGRLWLRGQVTLGMQLLALKKELGISKGKAAATSADSAEVRSWDELVKDYTGYSRRSCDEFIRLYEATVAKLKKGKKLNLPAAVKKDALAIFSESNTLAITPEQWMIVDEVIGTLTTGETQASLLQEAKLVATPKKMPKKTGGNEEPEPPTEEESAGQLAFAFFSTFAAPLVDARTSADYKKLLAALPLHSDSEHPLSLSTLEAELRATLADIEEAKQSHTKPARGRTVESAA